MSRSLRVAGFTALLLAVAALAFGPLASAGFVGEDLPRLVDGASVEDGPLARASLRLSRALWARDGTWGDHGATLLRLENLLLLLGAAACARLALKRTLAPWSGLDGARGAAGACAVLLACHPLAVAAVASARARGDLLALFLVAAAAACFLRGRQDKEPPWTIGAGFLVLVAGHASSLALLAAPLLAVLELFSARRGRPASVRVRTAATTLLVFGGLACLEGVTGPALGSPALALRTFRSDGFHLGIGRDLGAVEYGIAGVVLLAALQPAFVAARSAPRLWGWLAAASTAGLLLALAWGGSANADPASPAGAMGLLPAAALSCAVLAVASTSLSGARRILLPAALAATFVVLARGAASPWIEASRPLAALRADVADAREAQGPAALFLVVDPPGRVAGLEVAGSSLPLLLDPALCPPARASDRGRLQGISREALYALAREPEFAGMRDAGLVVLLPPDGAEDPTARRRAFALSPPRPATGVLAWQEDLRSPLFDVDPWDRRALRAVALPDVSTAEAPRMGWRAGEATKGSRLGVWVRDRDAPTAVFDLSRDPAWLLGETVHRVTIESDIGRIASAELARDVPSLPGIGEPEVRGGTWTFHLDPAAQPRPVHGEARLALRLLDLASYELVELPARTLPSGETAFDLPSGSAASGARAWSLEWRVGETCIARSSGRR